MVAAFDYCLHGKGGAAPSIDTAMHGLVDAAARRPPAPRLRDRAGHRGGRGEAHRTTASATACVWVPWRRPGFQLGLDIAAVQDDEPAGHRRHPRRARHHRVGRDQRGVRGATRWRSSAPPQEFLDRARRSPSRSAPVVPGYEPLPEAERRAKAAALFPTIRGLASTDHPQVGHYTDTDAVLEFLAREKLPRWPSSAPPARTTSCAPRSSRWSLDLPGDRDRRGDHRPAEGAARRLPRRLPRLLRAARHPGQPADARRRPGHRARARRRACSPSARTSRPPGWPASSTSTRST